MVRLQEEPQPPARGMGLDGMVLGVVSASLPWLPSDIEVV